MKSNHFSCKALIVVSFFCLFSLLVLSNRASAKSVTLRYTNFFPPTHAQSILAENWCREVEKRTQGRVKVQYFAGQTLTKAKGTYDAVARGIADVGLSCLAYTRGRFPVMSAIDLPFGYSSGSSATAAANHIYNKFQPEEFKDTQVMFLHAHGPGLIHTRDKAVKTIGDMKGLKIRSTGLSAEIIKALGGTPVTMAMPETYQSLQKGVVDGTASPFEAMKGFKLAEVVDFTTYSVSIAYTTAFFVVMNKARWNDLDSADQDIITAINQEYVMKHGQAWDDIDRSGMRYLLQQGKTIVGLDAKESAKWKKAVEPLFDDYVAQMEKKNMDGKTVLDAIRKFLNDN